MESAPATLRRTPLDPEHRALGAKMVPFAGWEMPVEYSGLMAEHLAVRTAAGLFDVSHMGELAVEGEGAFAFLQRVTCNDLGKLADGQAQYTALPMENGAPVDDVILYRRSADSYLLVANAANVEKDLAWLRERGPAGCRLVDHSAECALLALHGPKSQAILARLTRIDLSSIRYYHFAEGEVAGAAAMVARTGYTGEHGFELFLPPARAVAVWRALLAEGEADGLVPVGLGARDTLRLEAGMCLYGQDIDERTTLVEAGLGRIVATHDAKGDYPGRALLAEQKQSGPPRKLAGFEIVGPGIARHGHRVYLEGEEVGAVTSGTFAPFLKKSIGLAYLPASRAEKGTALEVEVRGRRLPAQVVPTPFYKRP